MADVLEIGFVLDRDELELVNFALEELPRRVRRGARKAIVETLEEAREWMIRERLSGGPKTGRTTSTRLAKRTGALQASTRVQARITDAEIIARLFVSPDQPAGRSGGTRPYRYAPVHEYGATIRPRRAQYLAIPLTDEARAHRPRELDLFVVRSKRGNLLLVRRVSSDRIVPLYLLREEVDVPARPFMEPTADRWLPIVERRFESSIADALVGLAA
jgi:hypothetical protein